MFQHDACRLVPIFLTRASFAFCVFSRLKVQYIPQTRCILLTLAKRRSSPPLKLPSHDHCTRALSCGHASGTRVSSDVKNPFRSLLSASSFNSFSQQAGAYDSVVRWDRSDHDNSLLDVNSLPKVNRDVLSRAQREGSVTHAPDHAESLQNISWTMDLVEHISDVTNEIVSWIGGVKSLKGSYRLT